MWGTNTGFTPFTYTPQGYALHQITAAAADAAAPLILDRLKQADRRQADNIPIQAINTPIQADKRREYRQKRQQKQARQATGRKRGRQATDRRQAGNIAKHKNRLQKLFFMPYG